MAWVGVQESGIPFQFSGGSMPAVTTLVDSVATLVDGATGGQWFISFETLQRVRITSLQYRSSYSPEGEYSYFRLFRNFDQVEQFNQAASEAPGPGDITSWTPNPFEVEDVLDINYGFPEIGHVANEEGYLFLVEVWIDDVSDEQLNCDCDSPYWFVTIGSMVDRIMRRVGMAAQVNRKPPGVFETIADYVSEAQTLVMADFDEIGHKRYFTWEMAVGQRFFGFDENVDLCEKMLNQIQIDAVYVKRGTEWSRLKRGIDPLWYSGGIHNSYPTHYDVRQCIEIWPPASEESQLIIFGKFKKAADLLADDVTTADPEAVFLRAVALYKAGKGHPDASVYMGQYTQYIGNVNADEHRDNRFIPPDYMEEWCNRERLTRVMDPLVYGDEP